MVLEVLRVLVLRVLTVLPRVRMSAAISSRQSVNRQSPIANPLIGTLQSAVCN